jgi:hypothetical protein
MSQKIASVNISLPYKGPGNVIMQHAVAFEVYSDNDEYKAIPVLDDAQRRVANLPEELLFTCAEGKPVSQRGMRDGNFHAIQDIVNELQKKNLI